MIEIDEDEQIVQVVWRHWFVLLGKIFVLIFAIAIPTTLLVALKILPISDMLTLSGSATAAAGFFLTFWLTLVWMFGWNIWTNYFLNVLIITDIRIFDINQHGFFDRKSSSFRIDHIQNIVVDQTGIVQTLLNFGTIRFETAGENINFIAMYIAKPYEVKKMIDEMQDGELGKSKEVHLHPDTLNRIAPSTESSATEEKTEAANISTFVNKGL